MLDLILTGAKTSTVLPLNGIYARELRLTDGRRSVMAWLVEQRSVKLVEALSNYREEGFRSSQELHDYLTKLYPALGLEDEVTLIRFTLKS